MLSSRLIALLLLLTVSGCDKPTTRLIEIREVARDDDRQALSMTGSGFPGARSGVAELTGTLYRAGAAARAVQVSLTCRALSDELLRIDLTTAEHEGLQNGLFEGRIDILFPSSGGASEIMGSISSVRVRFERARSTDLSADLLLARRAHRFQRELGALEVEATVHGLVLTRIAEGSLLELAGVRAGDRVERINGAPVERVSDLLPKDERGEQVLDVTRKASAKRERIVLAATRPEDAHASALTALAFLVALIAGALLPTATSARPGQPARTARLTGAGLAFLSFLAFGLAQHALDVRLFYGLPAIACLALLGTAFARRKLSGVDALEQVLRLSASTLSLAALAILSGTLTTPWLGSADTGQPMYWTLLSAPPAWLALAVLHAARPTSQPIAYWSEASEWLAWTCAVCTVALAAGAGTWPRGVSFADSALLSFGLLLLKSALLKGGLSRAEVALPRAVLGVCALLCPLAAWMWLTLSPRVGLVAPVGALVLGFWIARSFLSHLLQRRPLSRDPALAPFL